jgi:hypothetical protein
VSGQDTGDLQRHRACFQGITWYRGVRLVKAIPLFLLMMIMIIMSRIIMMKMSATTVTMLATPVVRNVRMVPSRVEPTQKLASPRTELLPPP